MIEVLLGAAIAMLAAEALDICRWYAERIVVWAAKRWKERNGIDHAEEWLDDLKERPGNILKLISAVWLALGAVVPPDWLTLGLPSLWRAARPYLHATAEIRDALVGLIGACVVRLGTETGLRRASGRGAIPAVSGPVAGAAWRAMRAASRLMPRAAGSRWLAEAESFLYEAPPAQRRRAIRNYLANAPRVIAASWAGRLVRRIRPAGDPRS